ncbi:MAG: hypothetical protein HN826_11060 [Methylococcales bacterium]|jgi:hypothetical protein|nr:hypothetical protein [Methylococcales bacterium]
MLSIKHYHMHDQAKNVVHDIMKPLIRTRIKISLIRLITLFRSSPSWG